MAFIIIGDKTQEIDRRELVGPIVIGRSPDVDVPVRDILLSRRHCAFEKIGDTWVLVDLGSKNGTRVNDEPVTRHVLHDTDIIRIGRHTRIAFREGPYVPPPPNYKRPQQRPADPIEAMSGTISGFRFNEDEEDELDQEVLATFPRPKPHPAEPRAYRNEKVYTMLEDIASTAWDSKLSAPERRVKTAPLPKPKVEAPEQPAPQLWENLTPQKTFRRPRTLFTPKGFVALLSVVTAMMLTATCVWVLSWSW